MKKSILLMLILTAISLFSSAQVYSPWETEVIITQETFGTKEYGTNNTRVQTQGWMNATASHFDWWEVTTFTNTNGYFESGSDSSIRIVSYNSTAKPESWPTPSGSMHLLMAPPAGYSGSWDTVCFKGINISNQNVSSVQFGWAKRGNMSPNENVNGLNIEISIDGGEWIQLDTTKLEKPLGGDKWAYAKLPVKNVNGKTMEIRFTCYANQIEIDDITVMGVIYDESLITLETFGTKEYGTNNTRVQTQGWMNATASHFDWWEVTTFTNKNGYFESGSDSSIRIVSYNSTAKPANWPNPSGNMHLLMAPPAGYSGSWDTVCFKGIDISNKMVTSVGFGWAKRGNMSPKETVNGLNIEINIDGSGWIQLDTTLLENPLGGDKWSYAKLPVNKLSGSLMEIRFTCYANQIEIDDIAVNGLEYVKSAIALETFGTKEYGTNNTRVQTQGWMNATASHFDWWEVTTFTTKNGYFESGSDSSIRIVSYNSTAKPASWPNPSGNMHLLMAPPAGYSGSWDTVCFKGIDIKDQLVSTVEFGWAKRGNMSPKETVNGLNIEISIDGGEWIQLDTTLLENPLGGDKWSYAILPVSQVEGEKMEIRFSCYANQIEIDDILVNGAIAPTKGVDFAVENIVVGTVDSPEDFTCNMNLKWDADNMMIIFDIVDDSIVNTGTSYQVDNIEVYFDMNNSKNIKWPRNGGWVASIDPSWDADNLQFRLVPDVDFSVNNTTFKVGGITQVYTKTETGYRFEMTFPWDSLMEGFEPTIGTQIGFDVLVSDNDATASDANRNQITFVSKTDKPYNDASLFGTIQFENMGAFSMIPDEEKPSVAMNFKATADQKNVTLSWDNATDNIAILYYNIYQGETILKEKIYPKETGNTLLVKDLANGDYTFSIETVDNSGNISDNKASVTVTVNATSVNEMNSNVSVFPNPATNILNISGIANIQKVEVVGVSGNIVRSYQGSSSINVAELTRGSYILKVHSDKDVITTRFIKN